MPQVFGKPGTVKFRGKMRAQMRVGLAKCQELIAYDVKKPYLSVLNKASLNAAITAFDAMLNEKN